MTNFIIHCIMARKKGFWLNYGQTKQTNKQCKNKDLQIFIWIWKWLWFGVYCHYNIAARSSFAVLKVKFNLMPIFVNLFLIHHLIIIDQLKLIYSIFEFYRNVANKLTLLHYLVWFNLFRAADCEWFLVVSLASHDLQFQLWPPHENTTKLCTHL